MSVLLNFKTISNIKRLSDIHAIYSHVPAAKINSLFFIKNTLKNIYFSYMRNCIYSHILNIQCVLLLMPVLHLCFLLIIKRNELSCIIKNDLNLMSFPIPILCCSFIHSNIFRDFHRTFLHSFFF